METFSVNGMLNMNSCFIASTLVTLCSLATTSSIQGARARYMYGTSISTSSINNLLRYLTFEVLEPNWHVMHNKLENAKSIDEVIRITTFFIEKCLKECSLLSPILLKNFEKLKLYAFNMLRRLSG